MKTLSKFLNDLLFAPSWLTYVLIGLFFSPVSVGAISDPGVVVTNLNGIGTYTVNQNETPLIVTAPCSSQAVRIEWIDDRFVGLPALRGPWLGGDCGAPQPYRFSLSVPARGYFAFYPQWGADVPPSPGWTLFREDAVRINAAPEPLNIYFADFSPGEEHQVVHTLPDQAISLGFIARDRLGLGDISINRVVPPDFNPEDSETWVFRPGEKQRLRVAVDNPTGILVTNQHNVELRWTVQGTGKTNVEPIHDLGNILLNVNTAIQKKGTYFVDVELAIDNISVSHSTWPVVLAQKPQAREPKFLFGLYDHPENELDDIDKRRILLHGTIALAADTGLSALLDHGYASPSWVHTVLDLAYQYGLRIVHTIINPEGLDAVWLPEWQPVYTHPAVAAFNYLDEPKTPCDIEGTYKPKYDIIRQHYPSTPIVSNFVGEQLGKLPKPDSKSECKPEDWDNTLQHCCEPECFDAIKAWNTLGTEVRLIRFYPYRYEFNLVNKSPKLYLPTPQAFKLLEGIHPTPWWYVAQTFGVESGYWNFPTRKELNALVHLALANGARGILGYTLQAEGSGYALVDQKLHPMAARDGSEPIKTYAALARLVRKHEILLTSHKPAQFTAEANIGTVYVRPRVDPLTGDEYIYVVNLNTTASTKASVVFKSTYHPKKVTDIYAGKGGGQCDDQECDDQTNENYQYAMMEPAPGSYTVEISLSAGGAMFLKLKR